MLRAQSYVVKPSRFDSFLCAYKSSLVPTSLPVLHRPASSGNARQTTLSYTTVRLNVALERCSGGTWRGIERGRCAREKLDSPVCTSHSPVWENASFCFRSSRSNTSGDLFCTAIYPTGHSAIRTTTAVLLRITHPTAYSPIHGGG